MLNNLIFNSLLWKLAFQARISARHVIWHDTHSNHLPSIRASLRFSIYFINTQPNRLNYHSEHSIWKETLTLIEPWESLGFSVNKLWKHYCVTIKKIQNHKNGCQKVSNGILVRCLCHDWRSVDAKNKPFTKQCTPISFDCIVRHIVRLLWNVACNFPSGSEPT